MIHDVATAYDIRWLVLERGDSSPVAGPIRMATVPPGSVRPSSSTTRVRTGPSRRRPRSRPRALSGLHDARRRPVWRPVTRREAALSALVIFAVALVVRVVFAAQIVFPKPEDTAYYVEVARNLVEGRGPRHRRDLELPDAAAALPPAGLRGLAAPADVARGDPDGHRRRDVRGRPGLRRSSSAPSCRSWPGGSPRTSPWNAGSRPDGRGRSRSAPASPDRGLPAARPALRPARLRRCRSRSLALTACLLMTRHRPRSARRTAGPTGASRPWASLIGLTALTRNEAIWLAPGLGDRRLAGRRPATGTGGASGSILVAGIGAFLVFAPWAIRDWLVFGSPLPGQAVANASR